MAFDFRGIEFKVADKGGLLFKSSWGLEGANLSITYRVPWDQRKDARNALLGNVEFVPDATDPVVGYFTREIPHSHEEGEDWLFCDRVDIDPHISETAAGTNARARYAELRCTYKGMPYGIVDDATQIGISGTGQPDEWPLSRYVTVSIPKETSQTFTAKGGTLRWRTAVPPRIIAEAMPIKFSSMERVYTWHQVPLANIPWRAIKATQNSTNVDTFDGVNGGLLLFKRATFEPITLPSGVRGANVQYSIEELPDGPNAIPDPDREYAFHRYEVAGVIAQSVYGERDFNRLFRPEVPL